MINSFLQLFYKTLGHRTKCSPPKNYGIITDILASTSVNATNSSTMKILTHNIRSSKPAENKGQKRTKEWGRFRALAGKRKYVLIINIIIHWKYFSVCDWL